MSKQELLNELEENFKKLKEECKFSSSFDELEKTFFLKDHILNCKFVSPNLSRQICSRIVDTYMSWNNYLHSLIMPNPNSMINVNESKVFSDEERKEIGKLMTTVMAHVSANSVNGLTKDKKDDAKFIDRSVELWNKDIKPELLKIMKKINDGWNKR